MGKKPNTALMDASARNPSANYWTTGHISATLFRAGFSNQKKISATLFPVFSGGGGTSHETARAGEHVDEEGSRASASPWVGSPARRACLCSLPKFFSPIPHVWPSKISLFNTSYMEY